ncbi:MAG: HDIG domain-containing protein [Pirellulaceae bacterium]
MSTGNQARKRSERVAQLELPPSPWERGLLLLRRGDVLLRLGVCVIASLVMWLATAAWSPPFPYRIGQMPQRNIVARVEFKVKNEKATAEEKEKARRGIQCIYENDPQLLVQLREKLKGRVFELLRAESYEKFDRKVWDEFFVPPSEGEEALSDDVRAHQFEMLREALRNDPDLADFDKAVQLAFINLERFGLLEKLQHSFENGEGSQTEIRVRRSSEDPNPILVDVNKVRIAEATVTLQEELSKQLTPPIVADRVYAWLSTRLPITLTYNRNASREAADLAAEQVQQVMDTYKPGDQLAAAAEPIQERSKALLETEHKAYVAQLATWQLLFFGLSRFGMFIALYVLCGAYGYYRHHDLLLDLRRLIMLQSLIAVTVIASWICGHGVRHSEVVALMLFAMIVAIAHHGELALLFSTVVSLVVVLSLGQGLNEFVVITAALAVTILLLRDVRSRTKLIYVGAAAAAVVFLTAIGAGLVSGHWLDGSLIETAMWYAFWTALSGVLMTGLLPFIERIFDVQTELSLLELGDVSHPLLQELVRRAPGTYNHSINVASLAESAADAIGGNGLLVRVGAYFHDIGKMLKPGYFVENQGRSGNRHDTLLPAMSTLIIIAHVKDGADLARQHRLPKSIVDMILQHHGTTLVEFFFERASKQSEMDPDSRVVDEGSYRYPGPKPQTREAAVLMLADAVESASRTLVDPGPARIESLVHDIAMKKLLDDQFDECGLTLQELRTVQDCLVKSLAAMYHGRVKYPDQQTA